MAFGEKEDVDSVADTPQPSCNLYGFFILLPINFETKHDLVSRKRTEVSIAQSSSSLLGLINLYSR